MGPRLGVGRGQLASIVVSCYMFLIRLVAKFTPSEVEQITDKKEKLKR